MASNFGQLSRFLARTAAQAQFAALVLAGALALPSVAVAGEPFEVAVVESISGSSSGVEFMDYLHLGQVIRLSPRETLVLSYKASCMRETITGGTVTVGLDRSLVQSGEVRRSGGDCNSGKITLTDAHEGAGRTFRGGLTH
jgi:hypothetical protein